MNPDNQPVQAPGNTGAQHRPDLGAIEARANSATPGPLHAAGPCVRDEHEHDLVYMEEVWSWEPNAGERTVESMCDDAEFFAHARVVVPVLIRYCRHLEATIQTEREQHAREVERLRAELIELIDALRDPEPCHFDHHGYCQEHSYLWTDPPCPHGRAAKLIEAAEAAIQREQEQGATPGETPHA